MERVFLTVTLGVALSAQASSAVLWSQTAVSASALKPGESAGRLTDVPPMPRGKSTILGGSIQNVDPVRDQFVLHVYGEKPMRILFDERTQVFRDGKKVSLRDFAPAMHASVQTTLDGASVFAISVHILSHEADGDYQGRVLSYNPDSGVLMLTSSASRQPFRVQVTNGTSFKRLGQQEFSSVQSGTTDLMPGSLVSVEFESDNHGKGLAREISVLAAPGATFLFVGDLVSLDLHRGALVVVDPRTNQRYQIFFDPTRGPASQLREGQRVRVSADYDGTRYVATDIRIE